MKFRKYLSHDRAACLALFDGNLEPYFDPKERPGFESFLDNPPKTYFVIEAETGEIVACGGYWEEKQGIASFCWGMADRNRHGQGLGKMLTEQRLLRIKKDPRFREARMGTSQHTSGFYKKFGFALTFVKENAYGPNLHHCEMTLDLGAEESV